MKYKRSNIQDPLTGLELRVLLDYVDTLELVLLRADTALSDTAGFAEKIDARTAIHEALNKGK